MKKTYQNPQVDIVILRGPALMLSGSETVNEYQKGADFSIGDTDEEKQ